MKARVATSLLMVFGMVETSCAVFDDRCGERSRDIAVAGRIPNPDDPNAGYVQLVLVERETTEPKQTGSWLLIDDSLRGHVSAARLRGTDGRLLLELNLELSGAGSQVTYQGPLAPCAGGSGFSELYSLAASNRLAVVVRTDLAGRDSLGARLVVVHSNPWGQPHCS